MVREPDNTLGSRGASRQDINRPQGTRGGPVEGNEVLGNAGLYQAAPQELPKPRYRFMGDGDEREDLVEPKAPVASLLCLGSEEHVQAMLEQIVLASELKGPTRAVRVKPGQTKAEATVLELKAERRDHEEYKRKIDQLLAENRRLEADISTYRKEAEGRTDYHAGKVRRAAVKLQNKVSENALDVKIYTSHLEDVTRRIIYLQALLDGLAQIASEAAAIPEDLQVQLATAESAREASEQTVSRLTADLAALKQQVAAMEAQVADAQRSAEDSQRQPAAAPQANKTLSADNARLSTERDELTAQVEALRAELAQSKVERARLVEDKEVAVRTVEDVNKQITLLKAEVDAARSDIARQGQEWAAKEREIQSKGDAVVATLRAEMERNDRALRSTKQELGRLEAKTANSKKQITHFKSKVNHLESQLAAHAKQDRTLVQIRDVACAPPRGSRGNKGRTARAPVKAPTAAPSTPAAYPPLPPAEFTAPVEPAQGHDSPAQVNAATTSQAMTSPAAPTTPSLRTRSLESVGSVGALVPSVSQVARPLFSSSPSGTQESECRTLPHAQVSHVLTVSHDSSSLLSTLESVEALDGIVPPEPQVPRMHLHMPEVEEGTRSDDSPVTMPAKDTAAEDATKTTATPATPHFLVAVEATQRPMEATHNGIIHPLAGSPYLEVIIVHGTGWSRTRPTAGTQHDIMFTPPIQPFLKKMFKLAAAVDVDVLTELVISKMGDMRLEIMSLERLVGQLSAAKTKAEEGLNQATEVAAQHQRDMQQMEQDAALVRQALQLNRELLDENYMLRADNNAYAQAMGLKDHIIWGYEGQLAVDRQEIDRLQGVIQQLQSEAAHARAQIAALQQPQPGWQGWMGSGSPVQQPEASTRPYAGIFSSQAASTSSFWGGQAEQQQQQAGSSWFSQQSPATSYQPAWGS